MTPHAVTGVGIASALGIGRDVVLAAVRSGACAPVAAPTVFDPSAYDEGPGARVAEVPGFDAAKYLGDKGLRSLDRLTKLLVVTARLALHDAGLKRDGAWAASGAGEPLGPGPAGTGIVVSNAYGSLEAITELDRVAVLEDARYINPSRFPLTVSNSAAGYVSIWEDLRALNVSVSDGNCGALDAAAAADVLLENDRAGALLVGGAEAMSEALFLGLHRLGFDRAGAAGRDDGPRLGEGSALLVVERADDARARGAGSLAEIAGYGTAFSAPARDAALVHPSADALERAIAGALADAGIDASAVDLVVSGVCGLARFDAAELLAIRRALGDRACVVAPKRAFGETLGAGGAMAMVAAIALLDGGPPPAPPYVVGGSFHGRARTALVTSLGYYGNASALVMRAASS